jgi:hypothetical protein
LILRSTLKKKYERRKEKRNKTKRKNGGITVAYLI